jgi:hypothetical protein
MQGLCFAMACAMCWGMRQRAWLWLCLLLALGEPPIWADGYYYLPEHAVLRPGGITAQQAVIAWQDGMETLLVSSTLDADAQRLGWVIPVPAVPNLMQQADPGGLKTLGFCVQPRLIHDLTSLVVGLGVAVIILLLLTATFLFNRARFLDLLVLFLVLLFLSSMLLGGLGTAGGGAGLVSGVHVEKTARVGAYDIAVLSATKPADLDRWLSDNGFAPVPAAVEIVAGYIRDRWVFVAIKLAREEPGENTPHPVELRFPSAAPVYPMKLTALAGGTPRLELFVLGPDRAECAPLRVAYCDRLLRTNRVMLLPSRPPAEVPLFAGTDTAVKIGHPDLVRLLWDGCVLTKLEGTITASQMSQDLAVTWTPFRAQQAWLFTRRGARGIAATVFILALGGGLIGTMIAWRARFRQSVGRVAFLSQLLARLLLVGLVGAILAHAALPRAPAAEVYTARYGRFASMLLRSVPGALLADESLTPTNEVALTHAIHRAYARVFRMEDTPPRNPILGTALTRESTPGSYTVTQEQGRLIVRFYDAAGCPITVEYPTGTPNLRR